MKVCGCQGGPNSKNQIDIVLGLSPRLAMMRATVWNIADENLCLKKGVRYLLDQPALERDAPGKLMRTRRV